MKIKKGILLSIDESDLKEGEFYSKAVKEVADHVFYDMPGLRSVNLPNCTKIGNYCFSYNQALTSISLPVLETCGYDCFNSNQALTSISLPVLETCGNYCFSYNQALTSQALTSISLPVLETCGNDCFSSNQALTSISLPVLETCGYDCFSSNQALTSISIRCNKLNAKNVDGYPFVIENEKTTKGIKIYTGYNLVQVTGKKIQKQACYVAEKEGFTAHGDTPKKAISDLQFKVVAEKLKNEPIKADTLITVNHYRLITGACEMGVKSWIEQNKLTGKENMRADELLPLLIKTNAYGIDRFKQLMDF